MTFYRQDYEQHFTRSRKKLLVIILNTFQDPHLSNHLTSNINHLFTRNRRRDNKITKKKKEEEEENKSIQMKRKKRKHRRA